jgi:hypothetical protein
MSDDDNTDQKFGLDSVEESQGFQKMPVARR